MKDHLCLCVRPALDGSDEKPKNRVDAVIYMDSLFWVFKWAGLPLIPHFQGQNWLWTWQRPSQGVGCRLNAKQGEQSLQTHSAKEPEGAPVSLKSLPTTGLQAHETLDKIVSGCESRLVNLTNRAIRSLGLFAFPFVFWLSFVSILWKWNGL